MKRAVLISLALLAALAVAQITRPVLRGVEPGLLFADYFTGENGTALALHAPNKGGSWTVASGSFALQDGYAQGGGASTHIATADLGTADMLLSGTIRITDGTGGGAGFLFRYADTSNYLRVYVTNVGSCFFQKNEGGSVTAIGSANAAFTGWSAPASVNVTVWVRGTQVLATFTNVATGEQIVEANSTTFNQSATRIGLFTSTKAHQLDNLRIAALGYALPPTIPTVTCSRNANYLSLPSYDSTDQGIHPDVVDAGVGGWNGYRYWMAYTPFTNEASNKENPAILASADGTTWVVPNGLTNPISATPSDGYNSDADLFFDSDNALVCVYRKVVTATNAEHLYYRRSTDGVTWGAEAEFFATGAQAAVRYMSPSIVLRNGVYEMWYVDHLGGVNSNLIMRRRGTSLATLSDPQLCSFTNLRIAGDNANATWHLNVIWTGTKYAAVLAQNDNTLRYAESNDGIHWSATATSFLGLGPAGQWDAASLYRSAFLPADGGGYDLWYSGKSAANAWHIGRTTMTLN